uniref:Uncharacterized protein n=1 Tax=Ditylenchus dipsaci TaxID=166011 RepID=A0A915EU52_9BILA
MRRKEGGPIATKKAKVESVATLFSPKLFKQKSQQLISDLTDFIVDSNLPFSIAESPYLLPNKVISVVRAHKRTRRRSRQTKPEIYLAARDQYGCICVPLPNALFCQ